MFLQTPSVSPEQTEGGEKTLIKIINVEIAKAESALTAGNVFLILTAINNETVKTIEWRVRVFVCQCVNLRSQIGMNQTCWLFLVGYRLLSRNLHTNGLDIG